MNRQKARFDQVARSRAAANIRHMEAWREQPKEDSLGRQDALAAAIFGKRQKAKVPA